MRRGDVDGSVEVGAAAEEFDRPEHVGDVHPAEPLPAAARAELVEGAGVAPGRRGEPPPVDLGAAQSEPRQVDERRERASVTEHDGHPEGDATRGRKVALEQLALPCLRHLDREAGAELAR